MGEVCLINTSIRRQIKIGKINSMLKKKKK